MNAFYVLEDAAKAVPNKAYLWFDNQEWTYAESYHLVLRYTTWFQAKFGVKKGDIVAMDFMNKPSMVLMVFGLWALGAKPAFINYNLRGAALLHCVNVCTASLILVDADVNASTDISPSEEIKEGMRKDGKNARVVIFGRDTENEIAACQETRPEDVERGGENASDMAMLIFTRYTVLPLLLLLLYYMANCVVERLVYRNLPL